MLLLLLLLVKVRKKERVVSKVVRYGKFRKANRVHIIQLDTISCANTITFLRPLGLFKVLLVVKRFLHYTSLLHWWLQPRERKRVCDFLWFLGCKIWRWILVVFGFWPQGWKRQVVELKRQRTGHPLQPALDMQMSVITLGSLLTVLLQHFIQLF